MTQEIQAGAAPIRRIPRQPRTVASDGLVAIETSGPDSSLSFPAIRNGAHPVDLFAWAAASRRLLDEHVLRYGAVLLRGFQVGGPDGIGRFLEAIGGDVMPYTERSTPRRAVGNNVYTSTEYPADQCILLHNENSYAHSWPQRVVFHCVAPALDGGATPLADCRRVLAAIDGAVRQEFARRGVLYVRNFGGGLGLSWQDVFGTQSRAQVEDFCRSAGYVAEWLGGDRLRTRRTAPAIVLHPTTREPIWFNHVLLFNVASLPSAIREALLAQCGEDGLPNNTYFADSGRIDPALVEEIGRAYDAHRSEFAWETGDLLLVDNMLMAHGRAPFTGPRRVVVGMADPVNAEAVSPGFVP